MNQKKRGLSKGLDALLAGTGLNLTKKVSITTNHQIISGHTEPTGTESTSYFSLNDPNIPMDQNLIVKLKLDQLIPGKFQPRENMAPEELQALVASIKSQGVLQPLIVRPITNNNYEIIAGERRWRAATLAELTTVPTIIKQVNDQDALTIALIENIQRENLNPLEEAKALNRLMQEFSLTHNAIAAAVGKSRTVITNLLRVLQLPDEIKNMLANSQLDLGHAKVLLGAPKHLQQKIANKIVTEQLSVRATEELLKNYQDKLTSELSKDLGSKGPTKHNLINNDPDLKRLQQQICQALGAKVKILHGKHNKGKLVIAYYNLTELEGILERMQIMENY